MIGFGNESVLMAGADTAVARDTSSLNTNPAGLARIGGSAFDVYSAAAFALDNGHADRFGNDISASNRVTSIAGGGFARRLGGAPVVAGSGSSSRAAPVRSTRTSRPLSAAATSSPP